MNINLKMLRGVVVIACVMMCGCALQEDAPFDAGISSTQTEPVPVLVPEIQPSLVLEGTCDDSHVLSNWLQFSMYYVDQFDAMLYDVSILPSDAMYDHVILLMRMRQVVADIPTPDCAEVAQRLLMRTMNNAIDVFVAIVNQERDDPGNIVAESSTQLEHVRLVQQELMAQLEAQIAPVSDL